MSCYWTGIYNALESEDYDYINYSVITLYFKNHIRCIGLNDPLFIKTFEKLITYKQTL